MKNESDVSSRRLSVAKPISWKPFLKFFPAIIGFALPFFLNFEGLSQSGHYCLSIFLCAALLWIFEPVPLFATAALVFLLEILLLSDKGIPSMFVGSQEYINYKVLLHPLASPLIILFLGGFVLADASRKYKVDSDLARVFIRPFGSNPMFILLGVMTITAVLSAFMSNTACTAMMMAVIFPAVAPLKPDDKFRLALILAVPFAANIGGMATPIGSPPNAVAIGALLDNNITVTFFDWVRIALPFTLAMLTICWLLLLFLFPATSKSVQLSFPRVRRRSGAVKLVYVVFAMTVLLWITGKWHGIPDGVVALVPVVIFVMFRILSVKEFNSLSWDILWLIAGGLALGSAMQKTHLTDWMLTLVDWAAMPSWAIIAAFCIGTVLLSTFISNTAAANLFIPIAAGLAAGTNGVNSLELLIAVGLSASLAMALPISTPPNAIAYATGQLKGKDIAKAGVIIGIVGLLLLTTLSRLLWKLMGIV